MPGCKPPLRFQLKSKDKLNVVLREDAGSGWEADLVRNIEVRMYSENSPLFIIRNRQFVYFVFLPKR